MNEPMQWLEENGPPLLKSKVLKWDRGPINPDSGAAHAYVISGFDPETNPEAPEDTPDELTIYFQNGVLTEVGSNGVTPQVLLEVLIDRFEGFQTGPFKCEENDRALSGMREALKAITDRQAERADRGVLNTMEK